MQAVIDTQGTESPDDDTMRPSCDTAMGRAYAPNRIVEVAEGFGENGIVQSICQEDFGPAIDAIVDRIASRLGATCLPTTKVRSTDGLVRCEVIWQLPVPAEAPVGTPTDCGQTPFLLEHGGAAAGEEDRVLCRVPQLAVRQDAAGGLAPFTTSTDGTRFAEGWYYDDFSDEVAEDCATRPRARIAFVPSAYPPAGVDVFLDCED
jgi:hypothetical protein